MGGGIFRKQCARQRELTTVSALKTGVYLVGLGTNRRALWLVWSEERENRTEGDGDKACWAYVALGQMALQSELGFVLGARVVWLMFVHLLR